jgi:hypothetical protein
MSLAVCARADGRRHTLKDHASKDPASKEAVSMRQHPLYFLVCVLFAIALEVVLVSRIRRHAKAADDARSATSRSDDLES